MRRFVEAGEQARFVDELPLKLVIIDERIVHVRHGGPGRAGPDLTMLVVEHPALAQILKIAFMQVWEHRAGLRRGRGARRGEGGGITTTGRTACCGGSRRRRSVIGRCALALVRRRCDVGGRAGSATSALGSSRSISRLLASLADPTARALVPGYRRGELAYFVVLGEPKTPAHRAALERAGARILREYRELDAFAVASRPSAVARIAALPRVAWLVPVDVVETEAEVGGRPVAGDDRGRRGPALWNQGITGTGIRIAVLDTGLDATHPDLDDRDFRNWSGLLNPPKVVDARSFLGGVCAPLAARPTVTVTAHTSRASRRGPARERRSRPTTAATRGSLPARSSRSERC